MSRDATVDAVGIAVTAKATNIGAGAGVVGFILSSEFAVLVGVLLALLGYFTNLWFQHRRDKREEAAHLMYMAAKASQYQEPR